jgi:hypothetical protein
MAAAQAAAVADTCMPSRAGGVPGGWEVKKEGGRRTVCLHTRMYA